VKSNIRGKVEKNIRILKLLYRWDTYRIEIQKDTDTIFKILLSKDTKYRFVSLSICIVSNRNIRIVNRKILTSMVPPLQLKHQISLVCLEIYTILVLLNNPCLVLIILYFPTDCCCIIFNHSYFVILFLFRVVLQQHC
jgi:hypothetical protein